jgi:hypothetical protein
MATQITDPVSLEVDGLVEDGMEEMAMTHRRHTYHDRHRRLTLPTVAARVGGQGSGLGLLEERLLDTPQVGWQGAIRTTEHILKHMVTVADGFVDQMRQLGLQVPILVEDQIRVRRILHHGTRVQVLGQRAGDELGSFGNIEKKNLLLGIYSSAQLLPMFQNFVVLEN